MDPLPAKRRRKNINYGQQPKRCWPFFMWHGGPKRLFRHDKRDTQFGVSLLIFYVWMLELFSVQRNAAVCFCVDGSGGFAGMVLYTAGFTAVRYAAICVKRAVSSSRALTSWLTCSFSIAVWVAMA